MSVMWQKFKCGSTERELDLVSSRVPHEPQFIYVDDVLEAFKIHDADRFEVDGRTIAYVRDDNGIMYHPKRIPCRPNCVIEVVYETPQTNSTSLTSTTARGSSVSLNESVAQLSIKNQLSTDLDPSEPFHFGSLRKSTMQIQEDMKVVTDAMIARNRSGKPLDAHSIVEECLPPEYRKSMVTLMAATPGFERWVIHKLDRIFVQGDVTQQIVRAMWALQKQMNDRLILIQRKAEAILTQNYELLEYTIPRLFIVLPETPTSWDPSAMFSTKFRLFFICECGEHTKPAKDTMASASKIPHELHLAKHEGYLVNKPTEFFQKYGPFLMVMLEMIKNGTGIVGSIMPVVAAIDTVTSKGIDYSLKYLAETRALIGKSDGIDVDDYAKAVREDLTNYLASAEGLEGADLRQLRLYLEANSSDDLLGNMYRMTTKDGHVKWVCRDHYRAGYQEMHTERLRDVVKQARGKFDEQLGKITIILESNLAAAEFYNAVTKAKGVLELIVKCGWECTRSDLEALEDALKKSRISIVRLDLRRLEKSFRSKLLSTSTRYEVLFRIRELPNMKMLHIFLPRHTTKLPSSQSKRPHLCKLSFELTVLSIQRKELQILAEALKTDSTLTTLDLNKSSIGDHGAQALSAALKTNSTLTTLYLGGCSIRDTGAQVLSEALKTNSALTTLDLSRNSIRDHGAQALSEALKTNSTLTTLDLNKSSIRDHGAQALSEALKTNSTLTTLYLGGCSIGDTGAQVMSKALKTNSTLTTLVLSWSSIGDAGAQALSEALQTNSTLTTLRLGGCSIGDTGAQVLSKALKTNSTLTTLILSWSSIGDTGAQALSEALKTNSTLTTLYLGNNSIGDNGAQALSEALKTNSTLTTLSLWGNSIGDNGALALSEALKTNSTLTTLRLERQSPLIWSIGVSSSVSDHKM